MLQPIHSWDLPDADGSIAVSPDWTRLGVGRKHCVIVYDMNTGQSVLGPLQGSERRITFSPDGRMIAAATAQTSDAHVYPGTTNSNAHVWDATTGDLIHRFHFTDLEFSPTKLWHKEAYSKGLLGGVKEMVFSHDGQFLVTWGIIARVCAWDTRTWKAIDYEGETGVVETAAISPDNKRVAVSYSPSQKNKIFVFDAATGSNLFACMGHSSGIHSIAFSLDSRRIISGSSDCTVRIWDAMNGRATGNPLEGHTESVKFVTFFSESKLIASASDTSTVWVWDSATGVLRDTWSFEGRRVSISPDGSLLVSRVDRTIQIWKTPKLDWLDDNEYPSMEAAETPEIEISSTMSPQQIVSYLGTRGCNDLTEILDMASCTEYPISTGGFGDIYRGRLKGGTEVAIKTLRLYAGPQEEPQKHLKHAARELYTWSKCRHPHVQHLLGLAVLRGQIGMIARWEVNGSLPEYLERHPDVDRCGLSTQIADGLSYLHSSGLVHGDLKGANVLISHDGAAQLADFGNAKLQEYTLQFTKTSTKESLSPRWAASTAPELFKGGKCDTSADVYALGMTILETITGQLPWANKSDHAVMFAVVMENAYPDRPEAEIPRYSEHGDTLWSILQRCWEAEAANRPTAADVRMIMLGISMEGLKNREVEMDVDDDK